MQFLTPSITLAIIALTSAAPVTDNDTCPGVSSAPSHTIKPNITSQYEVSFGAVHHGVPYGRISKNGYTTDVTTLLTFESPVKSTGKFCSFHFDLDASATVFGAGQFDVYITLAPTERDASSWPSGNLRDHHIERMTAKAAGAATWVEGLPTFGQKFPCSAGETYGGKLVGVGDADLIEWLTSSEGPSIRYS